MPRARLITRTDVPLAVSFATYTEHVIEETAVHDFRSLSASMCLAQSMVISVGHLIDARETDTASVETGEKPCLYRIRMIHSVSV